MILRRVIEHVKAQNWTAVVLDFLIVVMGVLMAFQITAWNERRIEHNRAEGYAARMQSDLEADQAELALRMEFWSVVLANGYAAIDYAEKGALLDHSSWATLRAFIHASQVWRFRFVDTTYTELRSAGELGLIGDAELRKDFGDYYISTATRRYEGLYGLLPEYRRMVRGRMRSDIMRYYWVNCHYQAPEDQRLIDCPAPIGEEEAQAMLDELMTDEALVDELRYWIDSLSVSRSVAAMDIESAADLAARVEAAK